MNYSVKFSARTAVAAAVLAVGSSAFAAPTVDANIEFDNTYRSGSAVAAADKGLGQSGRVELNAAGKAGNSVFVAGRASFLARKDGTAATDDMWIQIGTASADVKLGRFEAANLFPLAQDVIVNHAGSAVGTKGAVYAAGELRGRKDSNQFHAAGTVKLGSGLSLELGVVDDKTNSKGVRPVLSYAAGALTASLGVESGEYASGVKFTGVGVTAGYNFGGVTLTGSYATGERDTTIARNGQTGLAVTAAVGGLVVGVISGKNEAAVGEEKINTLYAAYSMPLFDIKGASITPALSSSNATAANGGKLKENSLAVRLNYAF